MMMAAGSARTRVVASSIPLIFGTQIEVVAESLYEAAALAVTEFRTASVDSRHGTWARCGPKI